MQYLKSKLFVSLTSLALLASPAIAQGTQVAFGGLKHDSSLPVEITSDQLNVDQATGKAIFQGDVLIGQGELRLSAQMVEVIYTTTGPSEISQLIATGNVIVVNGNDTIEAQRADYSIASASILLTGDVIVIQGNSVLSGQRMTIDLTAGTGQIEGRVKTILQSGSN